MPTPTNGLKIASMIRFDKIATIDKTIIAGRLGAADPVWLTQNRAIFLGVFGFTQSIADLENGTP